MRALALKLALAIHQINPLVTMSVARGWASVVVHESTTRDLDPWLLVELVHRETHWIPRLVRHETDGTCSVGLGQINMRCGSSELPQMLRPALNLKRTAALLAHFRDVSVRNGYGRRPAAWLWMYNPGSPTYAPAILAAVFERHL
jgi:hypothetical protein